MTGEANLGDACYATLVQCLSDIAADCPDLPADSPPLHRLRNLILVLTAMPDTTPSSPKPKLTLSGAMALASTSRDVLTTLREVGSSSPVSGEMHEALRETLDGLLDRMGETLRQKSADRVRGLYVIVDPQITGGRDPLEIATAALRGGARMLQLRDKLRDKGEILPLASAIHQLCQAHDADLIINDHVDLAAAVGSAGIHVGQTDLPVAQARQVLAPFQVLGRSNHEMHELAESEEMGADHLAFGAIYLTRTKGVGRPPQGVDRLREARQATHLPLVAIGGINAGNVAPVVEAGADAICVTAAVDAAPDPEAAAAQLVEAIRSAGGRV